MLFRIAIQIYQFLATKNLKVAEIRYYREWFNLKSMVFYVHSLFLSVAMSSLWKDCHHSSRASESFAQQTFQVENNWNVEICFIYYLPLRPDCEVAIREILNRTGGACPLCPNRRWTWPADGSGTLDWQMLLHFSRTHKITDGLEFSFNKPNQVRVETSRPIHLITNGTVLKGNVDLILKKFNPWIENTSSQEKLHWIDMIII